MGLWNDKASDDQDGQKPSLWRPASKESAITSNVASDGLLTPGPRPEVRRLSSAIVSLDDLSLGPSTVAPPKDLEEPSDAHETAAALELAKRRLNTHETSDKPATPPAPLKTTTTDTYAFAFDIDGVLIRGGRPIPEAIEAMKVLNGHNEYGVKM